MFGYVTIYRKDLSDAALDRYQAYYCGLCRQLGVQYGTTGRLALSYDLTFVGIVLSALYDPDTRFFTGRCVPHPLKARPRAENKYLAYAADMTVALAYYNYLDDWQDDHRHTALHAAKQLERHLEGIRTRWPRQCTVIREKLAALNQLESAGCTDLDALCNCFGALLGTVFQYADNDLWAPVLERMGRGLGGFIYLMDAYDDLPKDKKHGRFNALAATAASLDAPAYEARCQELLTQQLGICAQSCGLLPILADTPEGQLINNTLYAGVWSKYAMLKAVRNKHLQKVQKGEATNE